MASCACYYAVQVLPLHLRDFPLAALRSFRMVSLGVHKAVRCRSNKVTAILKWEIQGGTPHLVLARPGLPDRRQPGRVCIEYVSEVQLRVSMIAVANRRYTKS